MLPNQLKTAIYYFESMDHVYTTGKIELSVKKTEKNNENQRWFMKSKPLQKF